MSSNKTIARIAAPVLGVALLSGSAVALSAAPAMAAPADTTTSVSTAASPSGAAKASTSKVVSKRAVTKYKLSKRELKNIEKAKKFANTKKAKHIRQRESHGRYKINTGNGYYGAYQFDKRTWQVNGGKKFSTTANKAPKWAQDYVMWRTHKSHGWAPWGG